MDNTLETSLPRIFARFKESEEGLVEPYVYALNEYETILK